MMLRAAVHRDKINKTNENKEDAMAFKIEKEEYINKTFRLNKKLVEEMEKVADSKNISLNKLVVLCVEYALENLDTKEDE